MSFALMIVLKSTVFLACATLLCFALRRSSASTRHTIWACTLLSSLIVPVAAGILPGLELPWLREFTGSASLMPGLTRLEAASTSLRAAGEGGVPQAPSYGYWIAGAWTIGFILVFLRLPMAHRTIGRLLKTSAEPEGRTWLELVDRLKSELSITRAVDVRFGGASLAPMTWGVFRHIVVLPSSASGWTAERRRHVLTHELAHVQRNDGMIQILAHVACSVYWFNPLTWYALHRLGVEREHACDDYALQLGASPAEYASHLVDTVREIGGARRLSFAVSMAQPSQLEGRVLAILDSGVSRQRLSRLGTALVFLSVVLFGGLLSVLHVTAQAPSEARPRTMMLSADVDGQTAAGPLDSAPVSVAAAAEPSSPAPPRSAQRTRIGDAPTSPTGIVTPPQVAGYTPPTYTQEALEAGIEGTVTIEAAVDAAGRVRILRVLRGLGYGLDEQAILALQGWKFLPAQRNGGPVETITLVDVDFRIPPLRVGAGVTPPKVISRVGPEYPYEARATRQNGTVVVEAIIRKNGTVDVVRVVRSLGFGLDESAIEAIKQWKFEPGARNGVPVDIALTIEVNFNLK